MVCFAPLNWEHLVYRTEYPQGGRSTNMLSGIRETHAWTPAPTPLTGNSEKKAPETRAEIRKASALPAGPFPGVRPRKSAAGKDRLVRAFNIRELGSSE